MPTQNTIKAMFTRERITLTPARKPSGIRLLSTHKNGDFGGISVTERSCAAPISKVESHISDIFLYHTGKLFLSARKAIQIVRTQPKGQKMC